MIDSPQLSERSERLLSKFFTPSSPLQEDGPSLNETQSHRRKKSTRIRSVTQNEFTKKTEITILDEEVQKPSMPDLVQ